MFLVRKRWVHETVSSTRITGAVNNPSNTKLSNSKWKNAVLNPLKSFLALKEVSPRILSTFKRSFSKKMGKTPSSHVIHSLEGEHCWTVRDSKPVRLLESPRSLSVYILMSDVRRSKSYLWCPMSTVRCMMSDVRCPNSDVRCPMSDLDVRCAVSNVWCPDKEQDKKPDNDQNKKSEKKKRTKKGQEIDKNSYEKSDKRSYKK